MFPCSPTEANLSGRETGTTHLALLTASSLLTASICLPPRASQESVREQREKQLRELHVMRQREREDQLQYETEILRSIHKEMKHERAVELAKKAADADNLLQVAKQNELHLEHLRQKKLQEAANVRALEAEWA